MTNLHRNSPKIQPGSGYSIAVKGTQQTRKMMSVVARLAVEARAEAAGL